jgi:hypothetical protein
LFECAGDVGTFVPGDLQGSLKNICNERDGERVNNRMLLLTFLVRKATIQELWQPYFLTVKRKGCCANINKYILFTGVKADVHMQYMINPIHYIVLQMT